MKDRDTIKGFVDEAECGVDNSVTNSGVFGGFT
mgnify:CR=1 FL=1